MSDGLTTDEHEVLANYHMNIVEKYLHEILVDITRINNKPDIVFIEKRIDSIKRELELVKFYNGEIAGEKE